MGPSACTGDLEVTQTVQTANSYWHSSECKPKSSQLICVSRPGPLADAGVSIEERQSGASWIHLKECWLWTEPEILIESVSQSKHIYIAQ